MKKKGNLAATNQLIRFIRGDVKYDEFYDQPSQIEIKDDKKPIIIICGCSFLVGLFLILGGYLFLSRQLKIYQSQLKSTTTNLEATQIKSLLPEDFEAKKLFWGQQKRLYEDLLNEKLSMTCILKELSHLVPANIFFKKIFLKNVAPQKPREKKEGVLGKELIFEGSIIKSDSYGDNNFPKFLAQLNQSPFFQRVQVTYRNEITGNFRHGLDFILTCDLI